MGPRVWVPWATPTDLADTRAWMRVGFELWAALRDDGHDPLEVYPAGIFRALAGAALPPKRTPAGLRARIDLLLPHVEPPLGIEVWSHDGIDALAAALVARWSLDGTAVPIGHTELGCDTSTIWLPSLRPARS